MRSVIIDEEALTITAGGGCLWEDVDREAGKYGLATVGGTVNHTGIGKMAVLFISISTTYTAQVVLPLVAALDGWQAVTDWSSTTC